MSEQLKPELRFPEFEVNWERLLIQDCLKIGSGRDYKHLGDGDIPVYGTGGIMTFVDDYLYEGECVGIGRKGTVDKPILLDGKFWTVDTLFYTHSFGDNIPYFFYNVFLRINWKKYIEATGVPSLTKKTILKIPLIIPNPNEQQKIANFLKAIDKRIKLLKAKKESLADYKTSIMQKLFSQEIRFKPALSGAEGQNDGSDASTVLSTSFPEWEEKKINEICKINPRTEKPTDWFFYIDLESVENGNLKEVKFINSKDAPSRAQRVLNKKDLLFQTVRPYQMNNFYFNLDGDYVASTGYAQLRAIQNANFLFYLLHHYQFVIEVLKRSTGTTFPAINSTDLAEIKVKLPSEKEQTKIASFLSEIDKKINATTKFIEASADFKKSLLQKMFV